jgi:hypothetical protein
MDEHMCDGYAYGTVLRDPLDRMISNTKFAWKRGWEVGKGHLPKLPQNKTYNASALFDVLRNGSSDEGWTGRIARASATRRWSSCEAIERSPAAYDNFYVRTLAGRETFQLPAGRITRSHLEVAKARLSLFSVVILLEQYETHSAQLTAAFGWRQVGVGGVGSSLASAQNDNPDETNPFTAHEMEALKEANQLDYELYCFASALARSRTDAALRKAADTAGTASAGAVPAVVRRRGR